MLLTVVLHEIATRDGRLVTAEDPWCTLEVSAGASRAFNRARDRLVYSEPLAVPVRLPEKAAVTVALMGKVVLETEFGAGAGVSAVLPGAAYEALPQEKWVQLNPATDDFVVQLKLRKMPLSAAGAGGKSYAYGAVHVAIQADPRSALAASAPKAQRAAPEPATDRDRALVI